MSQFRSRYQAPPARRIPREPELRLRVADRHSHDYADSPYQGRKSSSQKISDLSFWHNTDPEDREEEEWQDRQSPVPFILIAIILVVAATLLWFAFKWATGDSSSTPPIIAADTAPFKVRPENPGGMMIPHQDKLVYGRLSHDAPQPIERLLPPPEQPIFDRPHAHPMEPQPVGPQAGAHAGQMSPPHYPQSQSYGAQPSYQNQQGYPTPQQNTHPGYAPNTMTTPYSQPQHPQPQYPQHPQAYQSYQRQSSYPAPYPSQGQQESDQMYQEPHSYPPQQESTLYGPEVQSTPNKIPPPMPQNPYKDLGNSSGPERPISTVEEIKPASEEESVSNTPVKKQEKMSALDQLIAEEVQKSSEESTKESRAKEKKISSSSSSSGKHKVQIASLPSHAMAVQEMKRLRAQYKDTFKGKPWSIQKVDLGPQKGFTHRIVVGSFPNHSSASQYCKKLRQDKIGCMVVSPNNN